MEFYFRTNQIIKIQDMNLESKIKQWSKAQKIIAAIFEGTEKGILLRFNPNL